MTVNLEGTTTNNSDLGIKLKDNDEGPKTSFITLTFDNSSWNTAQTITVYPIDDLIDEGSIGIDNQSWKVEVSNLRSSLSNSKYKKSKITAYGGKTDTASILVEDNDTRGLIISLRGVTYLLDNDSLVTISDNGTDNLTVSEDQADNLSVVIRLNSEPTDTVLISLTNNGVDADGNKELTLSPSSLNFSTSNWKIIKLSQLVRMMKILMWTISH